MTNWPRAALQILLSAIPLLSPAQTNSGQIQAVNASISGIVKDKNTGAPLKDYTVSTYVNATWANGGITMTASTKNITSTTDEQGQYRLSGLPPAQYHVLARNAQGGFAQQVTRIVTVAGHDLEGINFNAIGSGSVSGKVVDDNKEPIPGMFVMLVSREYYLGTLGYFLKGSARTNDRGEYTLPYTETGRPFFLMAEMRPQNLRTHSETPLNPKMRKRVPIRTWYPNSPSKDGAAPIMLRPGEKREGVDIEVKKSPSYCVEGILSTSNGPAALGFSIEGQQPSSGVSSGGGMFMMTSSGTTAPDGEFRVCDLYPGIYRLTVQPRTGGQLQAGDTATAMVSISDQDIKDLRIPTQPGLSVDAEVVLDGIPPQTPIATKANISIQPLLRTQMPGEKSGGRPDIPGGVTLSGLWIDDYNVRATVNAPGLYVKDVTYGGRSVLYEPLHMGSAMAGTGLRMTVGQDGGTISTHVTDKDGNPVSDALILTMPAGAPSEGVLSSRIVTGQTDQLGQFQSGTLAPGTYYVVATEDPYDMTPECISKLWQSHIKYEKVDLAPSGSVQLNLHLTSIR
jgi:hypothetical protein